MSPNFFCNYTSISSAYNKFPLEVYIFAMLFGVPYLPIVAEPGQINACPLPKYSILDSCVCPCMRSLGLAAFLSIFEGLKKLPSIYDSNH